jgi:hypothetical protein
MDWVCGTRVLAGRHRHRWKGRNKMYRDGTVWPGFIWLRTWDGDEIFKQND